MNILIKLMSIVSLVIAPHISEGGGHGTADHTEAAAMEVVMGQEGIADGTYMINNGQVIRWKASKVGGSHYGDVSVQDGYHCHH